MKRSQMKNFLIGIFVIGAVAIAVGIILFLEPTIGDGKKTVYVRFSNISGISEGTRVTFAGKPIGEVKSVKEVYNAREQPTDEQGRVYYYQLTLKVDSSTDVYTTDTITVQTIGLMGEKTVAIIPKVPPKGVVPKLVTDQVMYATSTDPFERALNQISTLSKEATATIDDIHKWFQENEESLSFALSSFGSSMDQVDQMLAEINKTQLVPAIKTAVDNLTSDLRLIENILCEVDQDGTIKKFNQMLDGANEAIYTFNMDGKQILRNVSVITQDIADGSGTLGKLVANDDLYLRVESILSKVNTLMNDLNHYGLLFQYNKTWQRQRTKRANLLTALDTPKEFRSYFESEIDAINTSLARIFNLMERVEESENKDAILESDPFKRDFSQLLREVESLSKTIKLYNEEMIDSLDSGACR